MSENSQHIIVIGAGLIGLCTAYSLRTRGAKVSLIDIKSGPCLGTSFSNSGMIHPSQSKSWTLGEHVTSDQINAAKVTFDLAKQSAELIRPIFKTLGLSILSEGCVQIYESLDTARLAQTKFQAQNIETDILLDPIETLDQPACVFPGDFSGNARDFGVKLATYLDAQGVTQFYNVKTVDIRPNDHNKIRVRTGAFQLDCDHIVVAAGIHTADILKTFGINMNISAVPGVALNFDRPADLTDFPSRSVMDHTSRTALTIFEDCVRLSGGWDIDDPDLILARWKTLAPDLMKRLGSPTSNWVGYRPVSPLGRPYISSTSKPGIWVNAGHGHMGWTLCAGSGDLIARMIIEGQQDLRFSFVG